MGTPKQLLPLGPKTVIRHCLDSVLAAGVRDVVVVLRPGSGGIESALSGLPVRTVLNDDPDSDMAGSVRRGLSAIDPSAAGVLVCLSDHPLVSSGTIGALLRSHTALPDSIIIPCCGGRRGHPTLFPRPVIEELYFSATLRDVITGHAGKVHLLDVTDDGIVLDLDTPEDYERIKGRFS